jgi:hypothetical protein
MSRLSLATCATLLLLGFGPVPAMAVVVNSGSGGTIPNGATYTINLPNYSVTDIIIYNYGSPFETFVQGLAASPLTAATPGPTTLTVTYPTAAEIPIPGFVYTPGESFLLGVASNLTGDAEGQQHLVVFTNDTFASSAQSIAFGTLFPNTNETTLINDLTSQTNPGDIGTFADGDALNGPNGSIAFLPGSSFEAVAFSDGQIIGSGTSSFTYGVPEPSTWATLLIAVAGLGFVRYRTSQKRVAAIA